MDRTDRKIIKYAVTVFFLIGFAAMLSWNINLNYAVRRQSIELDRMMGALLRQQIEHFDIIMAKDSIIVELTDSINK